MHNAKLVSCLSALGHWFALLCFWNAISVSLAVADQTDTAPDVGVRFQPPSLVLLKNAHIVINSTKSLDAGSLLIQDGKILAVGNNLAEPAGAEIVDCEGSFLYPAFVDAMVELDANEFDTPAAYWNTSVKPERSMSRVVKLEKSQFENLRKAGIGLILAAPKDGIIKGQSCVLTTAEAPLADTLLKSDVFQHIRLYPNRGSSERYPNSPMGATALVRQSLLDADWYLRALQAASANTAIPHPDHNASLAALKTTVRAQQTVVIDGTNELYALRADRVANELSLKLVVRGSGREYRQLEAISATGRTFIIPVNFPDAPKVNSESEMTDVSLQTLMHWRLAPENPGRLEKAAVRFVLSADGLDKPTELLSKVRIAIEAGLSEQKALEALTIAPAQLLGIEHLAGSLEVGKLANVLITSGPLFDKKTVIEETWVQGDRHQFGPKPKTEIHGRWQLHLDESSAQLATSAQLILEVSGKSDKLTAKIGLPAAFDKQPNSDRTAAVAKSDEPNSTENQAAEEKLPQTQPKTAPALELKELSFNSYRLTGTFEIPEKFALQGVAEKPAGRGWLTLVHLEAAIEVTLLWPDSSTTTFTGTAIPDAVSVANEVKADEPQAKIVSQSNEKLPKANEEEKAEETSPALTGVDCKINYPLGAFGRTAPPTQPEILLIKNATLWTCGDAGVLESADLLVQKGIIAEVGKNLMVPAGAIVFDATGMHVSPGIIDCHSHMATDGGVNESGQAITAEVRVGDFIDCNDITIYRQLAGGVTTANILHGSANPIGGQNQVIKLRWGSLDEELKMQEAPAGIKFALGENVKQSSREGSTRYPQSRMGVEEILRDRFEAARAYQSRWQSWRQGSSGLPPRRDLELEAIAEILDRNRWVHCHSYRQDEILMILRLLDEYKVTIGSLQHILEGYKVADAMAAHGATGSSFSDWWAYKVEVQDAIPYNGALMHRAGVVVSFNSDDAELARHLNHEAAKAVKYGGIEPSEALKFVTLNPAKQLRIDSWVGSLEPGKHADFVIWNRSPLSTLSMCMQTWIDGRKYFDRGEDLAQRESDELLRRKLVQLANSKATGKGGEADEKDPSLWWARHDEFCHHGHDEHKHH